MHWSPHESPELIATRGIRASGRAGTLEELVFCATCLGWDKAFEDYLAEFHDQPDHEAILNPPKELQGYRRALLAAVAETLAEEHHWKIPEWTKDPSCYLPVPTLGLPERLRSYLSAEDHRALIEVMRPNSPDAFRKRGIIAKWNILQRR